MSKFSGLIKAVQEEKKTPQTKTLDSASASASARTATKVEDPAPAAKPKKARGAAAVTKPKAGSGPRAVAEAVPSAEAPALMDTRPAPAAKARRVGRSADPDYSKSTMYIHHEVHQDVKRALIGTGRDYSELVEDLLRDWLKQGS